VIARASRHALLGLAAATTAALAACTASEDTAIGASEHEAQPIDRLIMGQAAGYPADRSLRERLPALDASMAERRKVAWEIVARVLAPTRLATVPGAPASARGKTPYAAARTLPRFQTWYASDDVLPMFDRLFRALPDAQKKARARFTESDLAAVFPWNATMAPSLASFTEERLSARLAELAKPEGVHSLGKDARTLMSPAYVGHLLRSYPEITGCEVAEPGAPGPSAESFAGCLPSEMPVDAAAVKMRWVRGDAPMPTYDTSKAALAKTFARGEFGGGDGTASPDATAIYTMQLTPDTSMRLAAMHVATKELRDWAWVSIWWSPDPDSDFGADRPASITALGGPWKNYKMCVVTAYEEKDMTARTSADDAASWCSNPYLELGAGNAKTNCIGCHQHGGTDETTETVLTPGRFPSQGRLQSRKNFPTDYAYTTSAGLDLAAQMRARIDALTPW